MQMLIFSLMRRFAAEHLNMYVPSVYLSKKSSNNDDLNVLATAEL